MARSLWNGTITFGAVAVPVKLHTAVEDKTVHFREVHLKDGAPIEHRRFCSKEHKEVPADEVVKGYEMSSGRYVVVEKEEIDAAGGSRTRIIEVEHFVDAHDIDPVFFEKSWYVGAQEAGGDAYRLLHDALERTGRAAIGRFTFHNREHLAAIRPYEDVLVLHTLRLCEELVGEGDLDVPKLDKAPAEREIEMARQLVESLHEDFDATAYEDEYRDAVLEIVKRKARGEDVAPPEEPEPEEHDDLLAALQASLGKAKA